MVGWLHQMILQMLNVFRLDMCEHLVTFWSPTGRCIVVRCVTPLIARKAPLGFWQPIHHDVSTKTLISPLAIYLSFPAVTRVHAQSSERRVWNNDVRHRPRSGGKIMWEKTNLLALHSSHSEAEYQTKKKNMRPEGNTVFSYILNTSSMWKGAGEGRENTQEREAVPRMWGRTLKKMRRWKRYMHNFNHLRWLLQIGQSAASLQQLT